MASFDSRGGFVGRSREMFDAVCARCKRKCMVPFKPSAGKDVYCKECYEENRD